MATFYLYFDSTFLASFLICNIYDNIKYRGKNNSYTSIKMYKKKCEYKKRKEK